MRDYKIDAFKKTNDNHRGRNEKLKKEFREHKKTAEIMEMEDLQEKMLEEAEMNRQKEYVRWTKQKLQQKC